MHQRHCCANCLLDQSMVKGPDHPSSSQVPMCPGCQQGKMVQKPFKSNPDKRKYDAFELIDLEICGPMEVESIGGSKYSVLAPDRG